jgi:hypothetical protein
MNTLSKILTGAIIVVIAGGVIIINQLGDAHSQELDTLGAKLASTTLAFESATYEKNELAQKLTEKQRFQKIR